MYSRRWFGLTCPSYSSFPCDQAIRTRAGRAAGGAMPSSRLVWSLRCCLPAAGLGWALLRLGPAPALYTVIIITRLALVIALLILSNVARSYH